MGDSAFGTELTCRHLPPPLSLSDFETKLFIRWCASTARPYGTRVKVTNPITGASAIVIINDRGPFTRGRDIDLSQGAPTPKYFSPRLAMEKQYRNIRRIRLFFSQGDVADAVFYIQKHTSPRSFEALAGAPHTLR
jgi:rare lipoprotein A (RlpA)-like double-psi beta-barrel protein